MTCPFPCTCERTPYVRRALAIMARLRFYSCMQIHRMSTILVHELCKNHLATNSKENSNQRRWSRQAGQPGRTEVALRPKGRRIPLQAPNLSDRLLLCSAVITCFITQPGQWFHFHSLLPRGSDKMASQPST